jgi:NTE family protein
MDSLPSGVTVHVLPTGSEPRTPRGELDPRNYRRATGVQGRIDRAHEATARYLEQRVFRRERG